MKTTIQRVKLIEFTEQEKKILCSMGIIKVYEKELILNDIDSQQIINILIEINPTKQEHKRFYYEIYQGAKKMKEVKETNNPVKEYKEKIKRLNQKELIKAFNNANPDRVKSKEEKERDEYFEAKKKALKEYYDAQVKKFEEDWNAKLIAYQSVNKDKKTSVIKEYIKQHNANYKKELKNYKKLYNKAYYLLNQEEEKRKRKEYNKNYYARPDVKEKEKVKHKGYEIKNKEKYKQSHKEYYQDNKEKVKTMSKKYYILNQEEVKRKHKEYRLKNKEKIKESQKEYYLKKKALKLQQATQEIKEGV